MPVSPRSVLGAALSLRDAYTQDHCERVEAFCVALARRCGLDVPLAVLRDAACLHDIGKITIPDSILLKPGRLDAEQWRVMKTHAEAGALICAGIDRPAAALLARIVRHHHENFDGSGYPDGLAGEDIPLASRIIRVVDIYDAMTTRRPYQPRRSHEETLEVMLGERGITTDPVVLDHFLALLEEDGRLRAPAR